MSAEGRLNLGDDEGDARPATTVATEDNQGGSDPRGPVPASSTTVVAMLVEGRRRLRTIASLYVELEHEAYTGPSGAGGRGHTDEAEPDLQVLNMATDKAKRDLRAALTSAGHELSQAMDRTKSALRLLVARSPETREQPPAETNGKAVSVYRWTPEDVAEAEQRAWDRQKAR